jgi:hypothetical protein
MATNIFTLLQRHINGRVAAGAVGFLTFIRIAPAIYLTRLDGSTASLSQQIIGRESQD